MKQFILLLAIASIASVAAECPNACSGHGNCEAFDQCNCHRGWQAADCSERQCAMGYAFTTTPQGDLNMDGDREDNSYKQLSEPGVIAINTNTITFSRSGLQKGELKVGDGIRLCNENFIVTQIRGREIATNDDFKTTENDDNSEEITSATDDTFKRRIKEAVLNTRHTQNCGTNPKVNTVFQGSITKGETTAKFTKSGNWVANDINVGSRVYVWCTGTGSQLFEATDGASATGVNNYGYYEDGVFRDGGRFLTIKSVSNADLFFHEPVGHDATSCSLKQANDHIVYRQLTTQARPNGDWEKWKGDFKGTNTRPGRGPTMNSQEEATYKRLGKDFSAGDTVLLGDYGQDEGHFYMECSNQGLCDRKTGLCECFDGYTGRACQRQACPEDCSGHGVCASVDQLRLSDMTKLPLTASTVRDDKTVTFDSNVWSVNLRPGDYIKVGNYPPMKINTITADDADADANYNVTHFLSGLTAFNNAAKKVDTVTLYNAFPETLPMGTEVYQVHSYDLWDKDKNMACKCDPRWTGYDCSQRKCPLGDDPLTVDSVDGQGTTTTTDDSAYTQSPEKQTLIMNTGQVKYGSSVTGASGMLVGHFSLTFEDYFGEKFVTRPIPTEVEMSVTVSTGTAKVVTFDGGVGLPVSELSRGDEVRIGRDIRFVEKITYVDHNTKTHIKSFEVRDGYLGAIANMENFHTAHPSGSRLYRRDVSKEIREALLSVPNSRVEGVSVEKLEISGDFVAKGEYDPTNTKITFAANHAGWAVGDLVRVRSHIRIVTDTTAMQKYRIKFESGCLTDDHCNHNGINSYDSDTEATCSLGGSCTCSLPTATVQYHGFGCTRKGKGNDFHGTPRAINHARPYKRSNSGDIPLMTCDKDELFSGKIIDMYGRVSKSSTTKIEFYNSAGVATAPTTNYLPSVGNELYIDGQVRTVVETASDNTWAKVDLPFTIYAKSDDDYVVPPGSTVYLIHRLGGVGSQCTLTDMPKLTDTDTINTDAKGNLTAKSHSGGNSVDGDQTKSSQTNPHTEITIRPMDPQEVEIGDRIRVDTEVSGNDLTPGTYITHTVDRIYYETANTADNTDPKQIGAIEKFTLNELVSVETTKTGDMLKVADKEERFVYNDQRGTTENKECSGRGLCDETSGLCQCFKGYTDDDCSRQNALASA